MEKVLKQRLITGLILAPIVIWLIIVLPTFYYTLVLSFIFSLAAWEWGGLVRTSKSDKIVRLMYTALIAGLMVLGWYLLHASEAVVSIILFASLCWWIGVFILVLTYPNAMSIWSTTVGKTIAGIMILWPAWIAAVSIRGSSADGAYLALYLFLMVWIADSAAYFCGRKWGTHKLAPKVSPGKSWEGVIGALFIVLIYASTGAVLLDISKLGWGMTLVFILMSLSVAFISVLGDLAESMFKRQADIKDSGSILPGHGGILDRIDSLTAAAPVLLMCLWWLFDFQLTINSAVKGL